MSRICFYSHEKLILKCYQNAFVNKTPANEKYARQFFLKIINNNEIRVVQKICYFLLFIVHINNEIEAFYRITRILVFFFSKHEIEKEA